MDGAFDSPPMIAGWDNYLTVAKGGKKMVGSPTEEEPASAHHEQKLVAEYKSGKYVFDRLEESGWSDKRQGLTDTDLSSSH